MGNKIKDYKEILSSIFSYSEYSFKLIISNIWSIIIINKNKKKIIIIMLNEIYKTENSKYNPNWSINKNK